MRAIGQSMLARANRFDEIATELDGGQSRFQASVEAQKETPRCHCGAELSFNTQILSEDPVACWCVCWCRRCEQRSNCDDGGPTVSVYGYGRDSATALADWRMKRDSF